jgi:transposase-like protein
MATGRRRHSSEFKARVALEALKGQKTLNELASEYGVHPVQIAQWKRQAQDGLSGVFAPGGAGGTRQGTADQALIEQLYQQIGQLKVELDWLRKKGRPLPGSRTT